MIAEGEIGDLGLGGGKFELEFGEFLGQHLQLGARSARGIAEDRQTGRRLRAAQQQRAARAGPGAARIFGLSGGVDDYHPIGCGLDAARQRQRQYAHRE